MNAKRKGARNGIARACCPKPPAAPSRAPRRRSAWDLIGVDATDVVLVQVKTRDWPGSAEMGTVQAFAVPPNCRRRVHRWRDRQRMPDMRELSPGHPGTPSHGRAGVPDPSGCARQRFAIRKPGSADELGIQGLGGGWFTGRRGFFPVSVSFRGR